MKTKITLLITCLNLCILLLAYGVEASGKESPKKEKPKAQSDASYSILLIFSWSHQNIGDIGITPGTLRLLERYIPEAKVTVIAHSRPEATREYLKKRFPNCEVISNYFQATEISPTFREALNGADLILYNSGMMLNFGHFNRKWDWTMRFAIPLVVARARSIPYGIYGQSFECFEWPSGPFFRILLNDASFVFCRDTNSLEYLKNQNITPPILEFGPDGMFAFDIPDEDAADAFMKRHQLQDRKFITVTIRSAKQGFLSKKREEDHAAKLRQMMTDYVKQTGENILICPEVIHEIEPARRLLLDPLPPDVRDHVRFKDDFWLPDEAYSVYRRAKAVVSMEMHSVILSLAAGTPTLHPRFVDCGRKAWMVRDVGLPEWLFDIDKQPAEDITAELMAIHNDFDGALEKVEKAMDFVRKRQKETMAVVKKTLEKGKKSSPVKKHSSKLTTSL